MKQRTLAMMTGFEQYTSKTPASHISGGDGAGGAVGRVVRAGGAALSPAWEGAAAGGSRAHAADLLAARSRFLAVRSHSISTLPSHPEDCVRRSNCPTQAKRRLEWATRLHPQKITSRPSFWDRRRESGKSTPLIRIACYDPTTSTSDQVYGGWPTLRSLKGGIPRTPLSWDSESRCTTR